jgi:hypothetical protein
MAPAFPFPPPTPPRYPFSWSAWVVIAAILLVLIATVIIAMLSGR